MVTRISIRCQVAAIVHAGYVPTRKAGCWEPFALLWVYYCYRRRKGVTTCEDKLIERAAHGDQEAFRYLWEAHHAAAMAAALRLCHQRALAEEITQGAFLLAWRGLPRFKKGCPFRPWLMRILYRHALDVMEKQGTYLRPLSLDDALASADPVGSERHLEQVDPQEQVAEREAVRQALAQLSAEQRRVIALRYGADLTEVDIAQVLGWPVGTVKSRLNRARERLRVLLNEEER
jgi:RNA polymerase sigma-70 factor, ECF subfamily